jgi:hypothetical protein
MIARQLLLVAALSALPIAQSRSATGLFKSERTSGLNKICYYNVLGSTKTLTVSSVSLCPKSYEFE